MTAPKEKHAARNVPKLRFPEFWEAEEWEEKEVGEVFKVTRGEVLSMNLVQDSWTKEMPYPVYSSQTKNNGLSGFYSNYIYENAITWTTDGANAGDVNYRFGKFYCTNVCGVLLNTDGYANVCVAAIINSVSKKYVSYIGNPKLMNGVMSKIKIPFPSVPEQQKIADCLASLDELIAAQAQKLDTLKTHKKGLMQQLFPAEGETVPKLRFPEFRDAPEWINSSLGEISTITSGGTPSRSKKDFWNGDIHWITTSLIDFNIIDSANEYISEVGLKESSAKIFPKNTILMAMYGQGKTRGKVAVLDIEAATNQACAAILLKNKLNTYFVFQNLASRYDEIRDLSNRGGQENLSTGLIEKISFPYPDDIREQQKIANCLSSLDELITAQTQKLDTLKTHKKGLMQQLFPSANGDE